jgi:hypothetical protein
MRRGLQLAASVCLLLVLLPGAALAECDWPTYWHPFSDAVRTANRVLVGTVTENLDIDRGSPNFTGHFTLRVDEVLRGSAPASIEVLGIVSELPRNRCPENLAFEALVGWQVAIAYGARVDGIPGRIDTVALIDRKVEGLTQLGVEDLSLQQVRDLAGLPPTDSPTSPGESPLAFVVYGAELAVGGWLTLRLRSRRVTPRLV